MKFISYKNYAISLAIVLISGCVNSNFTQGHGGMAERHKKSDAFYAKPQLQEPRIESQKDNVNAHQYNGITHNDLKVSPEKAVRINIELAKRHLDILVLEGAKLCFPASVYKAKLREKRMLRAFYGGLVIDSVNDLVVQQENLIELENQLDFAVKNGSCRIAQKKHRTNDNQFRQDIEHLLNQHNKFDESHQSISQKYNHSLTKAVSLLLEKPQYTLEIFSHSTPGIKTAINSETQAIKIRHNLINKGINPNRIIIKEITVSDKITRQFTQYKSQSQRGITIELSTPEDNISAVYQ